MMRRAALGVWDFVVGDDWRTALGVIVIFAVTAVIAAIGWPAWWISPLATILVLHWSVRRAASPPGTVRGRRSRSVRVIS
jgi:hypothetical protein